MKFSKAFFVSAAMLTSLAVAAPACDEKKDDAKKEEKKDEKKDDKDDDKE